METKQKPLNHLEKPWKPTKKHETTLKNHGNQPKTMKNNESTLQNHGNQPKTMKMVGFSWFQIGYVTDAGSQLTSFDHITDAGPQLTSFGPKNVTSLTRGPQLTSFGPKNVTSLTQGTN